MKARAWPTAHQAACMAAPISLAGTVRSVPKLISPTVRLRDSWLASREEWGRNVHQDGAGLRAGDDGDSAAGFARWVGRLAGQADTSRPAGEGRVHAAEDRGRPQPRQRKIIHPAVAASKQQRARELLQTADFVAPVIVLVRPSSNSQNIQFGALLSRRTTGQGLRGRSGLGARLDWARA
jgi:hypothetical protein